MAQRRVSSSRTFMTLIWSNDPNAIKALAERAPLSDAVLGMVVEHHPPPHVAQRYRIPKIWPEELNSDIGKALVECNEKGPALMMVTTINVDPQVVESLLVGFTLALSRTVTKSTL